MLFSIFACLFNCDINMFRRQKPENKAKFEHQMYLARENPEPIFDLSECGLRNVPPGIYSLCKVFLKQTLNLSGNYIETLNGGGQLRDLQALRILDIHNNAFTMLPDNIDCLTNLEQLYVNQNKLKLLPESVCNLKCLTVIDVSSNKLKRLPENLGNLNKLKNLRLTDNKDLNALPKSLCRAKNLKQITLNSSNFQYPPEEIVNLGTEEILKYICEDVGEDYNPAFEPASGNSSSDQDRSDEVDYIQAKVWELEKIKQQRLQSFLEIERTNEMLQRQEIELAMVQKEDKKRLLADITQDQNRFDHQLSKLQQEKEMERFHLIEQLHEDERRGDEAIGNLLALNSKPTAQLLLQEKEEEEKLLAAANKYNKSVRTADILEAMQTILQQESQKFDEYYQNRLEASRGILQGETENSAKLAQILEERDFRKSSLLDQIQENEELQKVAVGTLLERGDARNWALMQQVALVEAQLAELTRIEIDKRKLEVDDQLNDLAEKRINLSVLLLDLLEQQRERRSQLLSTLEILESKNNNAEDFWLKQYQRLIEKLPRGLSEAQNKIDPTLAQILLMNGVIHCLPFLAKLTQFLCDIENVCEDDLIEIGIHSSADRTKILDAFQVFMKHQHFVEVSPTPSAPIEPDAPPEETKATLETECVICMERECKIIFVPCGHICCCIECVSAINQCPLCRADIERKIKMYA